jgi:hypothetical protein
MKRMAYSGAMNEREKGQIYIQSIKNEIFTKVYGPLGGHLRVPLVVGDPGGGGVRCCINVDEIIHRRVHVVVGDNNEEPHACAVEALQVVSVATYANRRLKQWKLEFPAHELEQSLEKMQTTPPRNISKLFDDFRIF